MNGKYIPNPLKGINLGRRVGLMNVLGSTVLPGGGGGGGGGAPLFDDLDFGADESDATTYSGTSYGPGINYERLEEDWSDSSIIDYMYETSVRDYEQREQDKKDAENARYLDIGAQSLIGQIPNVMAKREGKKLSYLQALNKQNPSLNLQMNPDYMQQGNIARTLAPWTRQTPYTPSSPGVYTRGSTVDPSGAVTSGRQIADTTTGYGTGMFEGKLSNLVLNPDTGLYEKQFSLGKGLTALGTGISAGTSFFGDKGWEDNLWSQKGGWQDWEGNETRYLRAAAPLLALTPWGWGGAAALQLGTTLWDWFKGN